MSWTAGLLASGSSSCRDLPRLTPSGLMRRTRRSQLRGQLWSYRPGRCTTFPLSASLCGEETVHCHLWPPILCCQRLANFGLRSFARCLCSSRRRFLHGTKREHGAGLEPKSVAAPATVSGESTSTSHWVVSTWEGGRRRRPASQETCRRSCRNQALGWRVKGS